MFEVEVEAKLEIIRAQRGEMLAKLAEIQQGVAEISSTRRTFEDQLASLEQQREGLQDDAGKAADRGREDLAARAHELMAQLDAKVGEIEELHRQAVEVERNLIENERAARQQAEEFSALVRSIEDHARSLSNLRQGY